MVLKYEVKIHLLTPYFDSEELKEILTPTPNPTYTVQT